MVIRLNLRRLVTFCVGLASMVGTGPAAADRSVIDLTLSSKADLILTAFAPNRIDDMASVTRSLAAVEAASARLNADMKQCAFAASDPAFEASELVEQVHSFKLGDSVEAASPRFRLAAARPATAPRGSSRALARATTALAVSNDPEWEEF